MNAVNDRRLSLAVVSGITVELLNKVVPLSILFLAKQRLGLEGFGFALFGISFIELVTPLITYGYSHLGTMRLSSMHAMGQPVEAGRTIANIVCLRLIHSVVVFAGVLCFTQFYQPYAAYRHLIFALSLSFFFFAVDSVWVHVAVQKMTRLNAITALSRFLSLALIYFFVQDPDHAVLFAVLYLSSTILINAFTFYSSQHFFSFVKPSLSEMKQLFHSAHPFACILFLLTFFERVDILIVEHFNGVAGAALYAGAARIGHSLYQVTHAIVLAFFSEMIALQSKEAFTRHFKVGTWLVLAFMGPGLFGVWFVAPDVLVFIYGEEYRAMASVLGWITCGVFVSIAVSALGLQVLVIKGRTMSFVKGLTLGAAASLLFGCVGFHFGGLLGVAIGMVTAKLFCLAFLVTAVRTYIERFPLAEMAAALLPAVVMALSLYYLRLEGFFKTVGVGALVYVLAMVAFNFARVKNLFKLLAKASPGSLD